MSTDEDRERARWEAEAEAERDRTIDLNREIAHRHLSQAATALRLADRAVRRLHESDLFDVEFEENRGGQVAYVNARSQVDVGLAALTHIVPTPGGDTMTEHEPHAYAVETLWNSGGSNPRWGMAMEMSDYSQPLDRGDAEQLLNQMVEDGHAADAVRLVAVVVVDSA